eukprot:TRINITY_DN11889_c0_g1_i3.p1 TRINITY_DN11889_c0_g1~~TRINITY_DN11889_c0_g1_i3.p1  ORF type:complete len:953 (+),score=252.40 TRINITY_DN11889_c0_g1_i3:85-2943(+)
MAAASKDGESASSLAGPPQEGAGSSRASSKELAAAAASKETAAAKHQGEAERPSPRKSYLAIPAVLRGVPKSDAEPLLGDGSPLGSSPGSATPAESASRRQWTDGNYYKKAEFRMKFMEKHGEVDDGIDEEKFQAAWEAAPRGSAASPGRRASVAPGSLFQRLISPQFSSIDSEKLRECGIREKPPEYWILSTQADLTFAGAIIVNALVAGLEVQLSLMGDSDSVLVTILYVIECVITLIFVVELFLRARALGVVTMLTHFEYLFDVFIVLFTVLDVWVMTPLYKMAFSELEGAQSSISAISAFRILQLLRLVRIVRLVRVCRQLLVLVHGLTISLRSVFWVFLLLFLVMYVGSLFCASELGSSSNEELQEAFGSMGMSLYSHFKLLTLEQWPDLSAAAMQESPWWIVYFVLYIALCNLALVNLVTGLIMDGVMKNNRKDQFRSETEAAEASPFVDVIRDMVSEHGVMVDADKLEAMMSSLNVQQVFKVYDITLEIEPKVLFRVIDVNQRGQLTAEELAAGLLQLRGSRQSIHPLLVRDDLRREKLRFFETLEEEQKGLLGEYHASLVQLEESLQPRLQELELGAKAAAEQYRQFADAVGGERGEHKPGDEDDDAASVSSADPEPRPNAEQIAFRRQEEAHRLEQRRLTLAAKRRADAREKDAKLAGLVRQACERVKRLDAAVVKLEAEVRTSHAREAELEAHFATAKDSTLEPEALDAVLDEVLKERQGTDESQVPGSRDVVVATTPLKLLALPDEPAAGELLESPLKESTPSPAREMLAPEGRQESRASSCGEGSFVPPPRLLATLGVKKQRDENDDKASLQLSPLLLDFPAAEDGGGGGRGGSAHSARAASEVALPSAAAAQRSTPASPWNRSEEGRADVGFGDRARSASAGRRSPSAGSGTPSTTPMSRKGNSFKLLNRLKDLHAKAQVRDEGEDLPGGPASQASPGA